MIRDRLLKLERLVTDAMANCPGCMLIPPASSFPATRNAANATMINTIEISPNADRRAEEMLRHIADLNRGRYQTIWGSR